MKKPNTSTSKIKSTHILALLVVIAFILIPGRFGLDNLNVLKNEAQDIRAEADSFNLDAQDTEDIVISDEEDFATRTALANAAIPEEAEISNLIDQLSREAGASNLIWLSGSPSPSNVTGGADAAYGISISVRTADGSQGRASVDAVGGFLERIRGLQRLVVVDSITLSPTDGSATIEARFFAQNEEK